MKALLRHCDKNERLKVEHSNEDINKEMTWKNAQFCGSYEEVCNYFDDILRELDSKPKANTRYDRVVAMQSKERCQSRMKKRILKSNGMLGLLGLRK